VRTDFSGIGPQEILDTLFDHSLGDIYHGKFNAAPHHPPSSQEVEVKPYEKNPVAQEPPFGD